LATLWCLVSVLVHAAGVISPLISRYPAIFAGDRGNQQPRIRATRSMLGISGNGLFSASWHVAGLQEVDLNRVSPLYDATRRRSR
jgi:hypothetical protein